MSFIDGKGTRCAQPTDYSEIPVLQLASPSDVCVGEKRRKSAR
ncbi:MAG: hypothetical protein ACI94D_000348 [Neolewinella sp.]|jgi:hypothetical protein